MIAGSLCIGGPLDGTVQVGPDTIRLATVATVPASMFPEDPAGLQDVKYVIYQRGTLLVDGEEFHLYIPEDMKPAAAMRRLLDGYKPKGSA